MGVSSIVIWWRQRGVIVSVVASKWLYICSPAAGTSVVRAHMWDRDSIRESNLAIYCFVEEGQTKKFSAIC